MLWALLAAFLRNRPPWVQAAMLGICTGLFVTAGTQGIHQLGRIGWATLLGLVVAATGGGAFYLALRRDSRRRSAAGTPSAWVAVAYLAVWLSLFSAAVWVLVAAGGVRVAVIAIVPLVLLASPVLVAVREFARGDATLVPRRPEGQACVPASGQLP